MEYLFGLTKNRCTIPASSGTFSCPKISTSLPLIIEYDEAGKMEHLGVAIFTAETKAALGKPICDFQERLFLELFLQPDEEKAKQLADEYKVNLLGTIFVLNSFLRSAEAGIRFATTEASEYTLVKDSLRWTVGWIGGNQSFGLSFPANYDLISGMDKKEAEEHFYQTLLHFHCAEKPSHFLTIDVNELKEIRTGMYVQQGQQLFIKAMNASLYFTKKENGTMGLVYDRRFPEETVSNLFLYPDNKSEGLKIQITQRMYGSRQEQCEKNLADLHCLMKNGTETFVGIEKCTATELYFTVIYKSDYYNCYHLLYVETTPDNIFDKTATMKAKLYTYIPNQNIKNIYKEYLESRKYDIDLRKGIK